MISFNLLVLVSLLYVAFLFIVAFVAERRAALGKTGWLRSSAIYTLSLSIYCTAWTFYGAVGYAARSGLEFLTIYLGPTLVMIGWWWLVRKLVRIGRAQRLTSIADLISSRFGKSTGLGMMVTVLAIVGITPYIALQLQSVTQSIAVFAASSGEIWAQRDLDGAAMWVAVGLAVFTVVFGTRNLDAHERHDGIVLAIAVEAVVKLFALIAVGVFVVWGVAGGVGATMDLIDASAQSQWAPSPSRWIGLIFVSGAAFLCLPRMFQVLVVENSDERALGTASWAFPTYLMLMSLFVVPIAVVGLDLMPEGSNPDLFVVTLPLSEGREGLAILAFLGGFSSATSMVIVATLALATMVSNHIVAPSWLTSRTTGAAVSGDVRGVVVASRRIAIGVIMALGYIYFRLSGGGTALAAIGLVSFTGIMQVLPAMIGGVFWRGANRWGAGAGIAIGFAIWAWTQFLPSFGVDGVISQAVFDNGPFGINWLRPHALFGIDGIDPLVHVAFWSMLLNSGAVVLVSVLTFPNPLERLQGAQFVNVYDYSSDARVWSQSAAQAEDLLVMTQRILGSAEAQAVFRAEAQMQGKSGFLPDVTPDFIGKLEREMSGSIGAAAAHAMIGQLTEGATVSVDDLMAVADETAQIVEYSNQLEAKSAEQERTARALQEANDKLTALSIQKDAFLSQISHELRTPMTSIRSFSDILRDGEVDGDARRRFAGIIHDETNRLTRLLDDLLDLGVLESGQVQLNIAEGRLADVLDRAVLASGIDETRVSISRRANAEAVTLSTDLERLSQVFINLISNVAKYCDADKPELRIIVRPMEGQLVVDFCDNGTGVPEESQSVIFEKFSRLEDEGKAGGAGLGLAICRQIMTAIGGGIAYLPGQGGAAFRVTIPTA
ncbi:ATP-binding protein [Octadecabacter sp. 1_MG-2023]|uniref:ATP-binding protein n=1 Tax=unclassified Octadecabacter TaxID=196158 RepID=UPI001C098BA5|nr:MULTISPECIES: ATP-binding protein [unclassified Octadecabacter]MBU2993005.1 sodium:solute symporter [Octadecabacter sp. B2R22]MDO6733543.1 ATP-binding protein [Octadecabacter sp. 1_MG-2023]